VCARRLGVGWSLGAFSSQILGLFCLLLWWVSEVGDFEWMRAEMRDGDAEPKGGEERGGTTGGKLIVQSE